MKILLSKIFRIPNETVTERVACEAERLYGYPVKESEISLSFTPHDKEWFTVKGAGKILLSVPCSRCTEETPYEAELDFEYKVNRATMKDEDGEPVYFLSEEELDTEELLSSEVSYVLPYTVLCKEDCKGLCPMCGQNLNIGECKCDPELERSAFSALKALLDVKDDKEV